MTVFWVSGSPAPQGSKRHVGHGFMVESSKAVGPWREAVRGETQRAFSEPVEGPVRVTVSFYLARPKSTRRLVPCVRPDLDKLARAVLDGLVMGGAFADDAQVTELLARKLYGKPGAMIAVEPARATNRANAKEPSL